MAPSSPEPRNMSIQTDPVPRGDGRPALATLSEPEIEAAKPLAGLRVLDLSRMVAGGIAGMLLADFGADVVKVEQPGVGDPLRQWTTGGEPYVVEGLRAQQAVRHAQPQVPRRAGSAAAAAATVRRGHGVVRPGHAGADGTRLGHAEGLASRPDPAADFRVGTGRTGERPAGIRHAGRSGQRLCRDERRARRAADRPELSARRHDLGAVRQQRHHVRPLSPVRNGGAGQVIDVSLFESLFSLLGPLPAEYAALGRERTRQGSRSRNAGPRGCYRTSDDGWIAVSGSTPKMAERFLRSYGLDALLDDPRFATNEARVQHALELDHAIADAIASRTLAENVAIIEANKLTAMPVQTVADIERGSRTGRRAT